MENLLKYLFPPKCLFCGSVGSLFCDNCLSECPILTTQYCLLCDNPSQNGVSHDSCYQKLKTKTVAWCRCIFKYEGKIRDCIRYSKYGAKQFLSMRKLCVESAAIFCETWNLPKCDACFPIPSAPKKLAARGFNQANMVAEEISRRLSIPVKKDVLVRVKNTEAQYTKSRQGRTENVKGSFAVRDSSSVADKKIMLVDDICTTGATFLESSKVLYAAGAAEVMCFALSKRLKYTEKV